jgi:hypothetical protein
MARVVNLFSWAVPRELVPPDRVHGLREVPPLRPGELQAVVETAPREAVDDALVEAGVDLGDPRPDFRVGDGCGLLFVPATSEPGWQRWSPTQGPAPKPKDGHILVTLVLLRDGREGATVCQIREVYGRDKSLRGPLYKPAIRLAPANNAESARLLDTLRALLAGGEAA